VTCRHESARLAINIEVNRGLGTLDDRIWLGVYQILNLLSPSQWGASDNSVKKIIEVKAYSLYQIRFVILDF